MTEPAKRARPNIIDGRPPEPDPPIYSMTPLTQTVFQSYTTCKENMKMAGILKSRFSWAKPEVPFAAPWWKPLICDKTDKDTIEECRRTSFHCRYNEHQGFLATGNTHTIVMTPNHQTYSWGQHQMSLVKPRIIGRVVAVAAGESCNYAINESGSVWAWGPMYTVTEFSYEDDKAVRISAFGRICIAITQSGRAKVISWRNEGQRLVADAPDPFRTIALT